MYGSLIFCFVKYVCDVRSLRLLDRPALNNVRTSSPSTSRSCRGMNAKRPNCRTFPPTASCGYPPSCGKVCAKEQKKSLPRITQKALSRAIQFAIIQRNYYITRKRRGQGALFGRVLVICQRLSGMSPLIPPPECRIRIPPYH